MTMNEARALQLSPCRTVVTSFNPRQTPTSSCQSNHQNGNNNNNSMVEAYFDDGDWVLCVESSPSYISCALSSGEIQVFDPRRLHIVRSFPKVHGNGMTTDLVGAPPQQNADHILVSSGTDGRVCVLDMRQQQQQTVSLAFSLPHSHEEALSVSLGYDGNLAAVGSNKARIHFYDLRQTHQPLGSYVNSHTDEVTRVRFQQFPNYVSSSSTAGSLLLTGSEDGLAYVFDTTQPSEEAAIKSVMNAQTSLRQVGFFGPNFEGVFCMTGSETMSLWSWDTAQCWANYNDIRTTLGVDYLVNAHWDYGRKELSVLAGCNNGDACLNTLSVGESTLVGTTTSSPRPHLTTSHRLAGGHRGVVRDWCPISASLLVTVGEDARLCEWNMTGRQSHSASNKSVYSISSSSQPIKRGSDAARNNHSQQQSMDESNRKVGGGPVRRQRNKRFTAPY